MCYAARKHYFFYFIGWKPRAMAEQSSHRNKKACTLIHKMKHRINIKQATVRTGTYTKLKCAKHAQ